MKGFRIRHNNTELAIALADNEVSGVHVDNKWCGIFYINAGGCDKQGLSHKWYSQKFLPGDELEISFEDIPEKEVSTARIIDMTNAMDRKTALLESYYQLKRELESEGIL
jgi:hypothetical protein